EIAVERVGVDVQTVQARRELVRGTAGEAQDVGEGLPFGVPGAGGPLELVVGRRQDRRDETGNAPGSGARGDRRDGIALVRHGRRTAGRILAHLTELGARHEYDVGGGFGDRARG